MGSNDNCNLSAMFLFIIVELAPLSTRAYKWRFRSCIEINRKVPGWKDRKFVFIVSAMSSEDYCLA